MAYPEHWSAIRSRQSTNTHPAPPSPYLARIRSEATRRGLYAAGPVTQPPPPAPAVPIGKDAARPPTSLSPLFGLVSRDRHRPRQDRRRPRCNRE